jgi:hypothetical protein
MTHGDEHCSKHH